MSQIPDYDHLTFIMNIFDRPFTISGYTTTLNCLEMRYPVEASINSLLGFCDEVIVVDSGSSDGTQEFIERLSSKDSRVKLFVEPVDFSHPRWAVHNDGYLKAKARDKCSGTYCWQMDVDEIVAAQGYEKINKLAPVTDDGTVLMLPMVEFWGGFERARADFLSFKLRLSKNDPRVTHGIPEALRLYDESGHEYPRPFDSDCCNYIYRDTLVDLNPQMLFPNGYEKFYGANDSRFEKFFNESLDLMPFVYHLSWLDIGRKIRHHRSYWHRYQASMYNIKLEDTAENNVFFDKPWCEVTELDIERKVEQLKVIGPRSFHHKIDSSDIGKTIPFTRSIPKELLDWYEEQVASPAPTPTLVGSVLEESALSLLL